MLMNPLKRGKELARAAGEAVGVLTPALPDAQSAAEQRRLELVAAQSAVVNAEEHLQAAHDRGADATELGRLEAALADSRINGERAQRAYAGAEKRLTKAREAAAAGMVEASIVKLNDALAIRKKAAAELDRLAELIAEQEKIIDGQIGPINEARRDGAGPRYFAPLTSGQRAAELAIERTRARDKTQQLSALDAIERDNGSLLADAATA